MSATSKNVAGVLNLSPEQADLILKLKLYGSDLTGKKMGVFGYPKPSAQQSGEMFRIQEDLITRIVLNLSDVPQADHEFWADAVKLAVERAVDASIAAIMGRQPAAAN